MIIEQIFPNIVGEKSDLPKCIEKEIKSRGLSNELASSIINSLPSKLSNTYTFFDTMTQLWRYEYGIPYRIGNQVVWGTHRANAY
jgi:hypothetical protein